MAAIIGKRKRDTLKQRHSTPIKIKKASADATAARNGHAVVPSNTNGATSDGVLPDHPHGDVVAVQIVTGSYERVLHGVCAAIPYLSWPPGPVHNESADDDGAAEQEHRSDGDVSFSDTFLFAAHASSIRCLALSPAAESDKRILATGGSDERINLYSISTLPPRLASSGTPAPSTSLWSATTVENPRNRPLGNLTHHDRAITRLHFPGKSKLFSAAEDSTVAVSRTRDWTVLSSIKAPIPKPHGRPSGDTAAGPGDVPAGVTDFAIHPSQKLMLSVGRGERCMRLWNLMTGKKAGVLNFDRELLARVGEGGGRTGSGEGRRVLWDEAGTKFVVAFDRGAVVFGIDSKPAALLRPSPATKLHQLRFLPGRRDILAVSTEDGRILFFDATLPPPDQPDIQNLPSCPCVAQIGGPAAGLMGRVKDFEILCLPRRADVGEDNGEKGEDADGNPLLIVAGGSDGGVRLWAFSYGDIARSRSADGAVAAAPTNGEDQSQHAPQVGKLIGTLETGNRITCLGAFVMSGVATGEGFADGQDGVGLDAEEDDRENSDGSE